MEKHEASDEEMKAANEELQAMNEELRAASEELETSRRNFSQSMSPARARKLLSSVSLLTEKSGGRPSGLRRTKQLAERSRHASTHDIRLIPPTFDALLFYFIPALLPDPSKTPSI